LEGKLKSIKTNYAVSIILCLLYFISAPSSHAARNPNKKKSNPSNVTFRYRELPMGATLPLRVSFNEMQIIKKFGRRSLTPLEKKFNSILLGAFGTVSSTRTTPVKTLKNVKSQMKALAAQCTNNSPLRIRALFWVVHMDELLMRHNTPIKLKDYVKVIDGYNRILNEIKESDEWVEPGTLNQNDESQSWHVLNTVKKDDLASVSGRVKLSGELLNFVYQPRNITAATIKYLNFLCPFGPEIFHYLNSDFNISNKKPYSFFSGMEGSRRSLLAWQTVTYGEYPEYFDTSAVDTYLGENAFSEFRKNYPKSIGKWINDNTMINTMMPSSIEISVKRVMITPQFVNRTNWADLIVDSSIKLMLGDYKGLAEDLLWEYAVEQMEGFRAPEVDKAIVGVLHQGKEGIEKAGHGQRVLLKVLRSEGKIPATPGQMYLSLKNLTGVKLQALMDAYMSVNLPKSYEFNKAPIAWIGEDYYGYFYHRDQTDGYYHTDLRYSPRHQNPVPMVEVRISGLFPEEFDTEHDYLIFETKYLPFTLQLKGKPRYQPLKNGKRTYDNDEQIDESWNLAYSSPKEIQVDRLVTGPGGILFKITGIPGEEQGTLLGENLARKEIIEGKAWELRGDTSRVNVIIKDSRGEIVTTNKAYFYEFTGANLPSAATQSSIGNTEPGVIVIPLTSKLRKDTYLDNAGTFDERAFEYSALASPDILRKYEITVTSKDKKGREKTTTYNVNLVKGTGGKFSIDRDRFKEFITVELESPLKSEGLTAVAGRYGNAGYVDITSEALETLDSRKPGSSLKLTLYYAVSKDGPWIKSEYDTYVYPKEQIRDAQYGNQKISKDTYRLSAKDHGHSEIREKLPHKPLYYKVGQQFYLNSRKPVGKEEFSNVVPPGKAFIKIIKPKLKDNTIVSYVKGVDKIYSLSCKGVNVYAGWLPFRVSLQLDNQPFCFQGAEVTVKSGNWTGTFYTPRKDGKRDCGNVSSSRTPVDVMIPYLPSKANITLTAKSEGGLYKAKKEISIKASKPVRNQSTKEDVLKRYNWQLKIKQKKLKELSSKILSNPARTIKTSAATTNKNKNKNKNKDKDKKKEPDRYQLMGRIGYEINLAKDEMELKVIKSCTIPFLKKAEKASLDAIQGKWSNVVQPINEKTKLLVKERDIKISYFKEKASLEKKQATHREKKKYTKRAIDKANKNRDWWINSAKRICKEELKKTYDDLMNAAAQDGQPGLYLSAVNKCLEVTRESDKDNLLKDSAGVYVIIGGSRNQAAQLYLQGLAYDLAQQKGPDSKKRFQENWQRRMLPSWWPVGSANPSATQIPSSPLPQKPGKKNKKPTKYTIAR
jgi:hypothetical protein